MPDKRFLRRKTKIVCTLGPATSSDQVIKSLIRAGMDVARLNFSHGTHSEHLKTIDKIRRASAELGRDVAIIQDLPGPKFRIGNIKGGSVMLKRGERITLTASPTRSESAIPLREASLPKLVQKGSKIFLSDGSIGLRVESVSKAEIHCICLNGGQLFSGKGVNIPRLAGKLETFTKADRNHALFGLKKGVDMIAVSFVRSADDIKQVRAFVSRHSRNPPWIIAKIEKREALEDLGNIIRNSDGVMVARGDLGVENPIEQIPEIQKRIISLCNENSKPVITATQMLESMVENPRPTRAEVTDVANSIFDGTDAVMLSEETAVGRYPVECVRVLHKVALNAEERMGDERISLNEHSVDIGEAASLGAIRIAKDVRAHALITPTDDGEVACRLARFKPRAPIIAVTANRETARRLKLAWGVNSLLASSSNLDEMLREALNTLTRVGVLEEGDRAVVFCDSMDFLKQEGKLLFVTNVRLR